MAEEIYVIGRVVDVKQAYVDLSEEEKKELGKKTGEAREAAGGRWL